MNRALSRVPAHALALALLVLATATNLSCNVNEYCLNCATGDGGPTDDALDGGDADDGGNGDAPDASTCLPSGPEVCDGDDNDCDGTTDEGALPTIGQPCDNQMGECAGGIRECTNGAVTCSKPPMPEQCDLLDNDCNGLTDEGDPGGGAVCGTNVGECVAGFNRCVSGQIECVGAIGTVNGQAETCNNRDDDCDGAFDEGIAAIGPCPGGTDQGLCSTGTLMCVGGTPTCVGRVDPTFELCNAFDEDCDGHDANGYSLADDPQNCGACGNVCDLDHAFEGCANMACTVVACETNFHNNNNDPTDGCEFGPCPKQSDFEVCNGADDNCNGDADEGLTPPANLCLTAGQCGTGDEQTVGTDTDADGSTASCGGAMGFSCTYNDPDVSAVGGVIQAETLCDGKDNDCDGRVDEGQPNLGQACDNGEQGDCRSTGTFACDTSDLDGPAVCIYDQVAPGMGTETCDGRDNNCNGVVDEGASTGSLAGQSWITIPGSATEIMQYEASRPDATDTLTGSSDTHVCSRPMAQPWTNVTHPQAEAACAAVGARLCTESEWESMCAQPVTPVYPVAGPSGAIGSITDFVFLEAEHASTNATVNGKTWTVDPIQNYSGTTSLRALPDSGSSPNSSQAPTQSARLDFRMSLAASTSYYVWVRMFTPENFDDMVYVGINATQPGTANALQLISPVNNRWVWVRGAAIATGAAGNYYVSVYQGDDGTYVDSIVVTRSSSLDVPSFDENIWAFSTSPKFPQPQTCNGDEYDTTAGGADQDGILATGSLPACFANGPGAADAFDMSGNVKEWTAERTSNQNPIRGGSANNEVDGLACGLDFTLANDQFFFPNVGFRCCR